VPELLQGAYDGKFARARAILGPRLNGLGYWKGAPLYNQDLAKAKSYLAAAGVQASSLKLSVSYDTSQAEGPTAAQVIQANLGYLGIACDIIPQTDAIWNTLTPNVQSQRQLSYVTFGTQAPEPSFFTEWFTCAQVGVYNYASWCNQQFTSLGNQGTGTTN